MIGREGTRYEMPKTVTADATKIDVNISFLLNSKPIYH